MHPIRVAIILRGRGFDDDYMIAALFHDLIEDTDTTYDDIVAVSNKRIADCVMLLTKKKGYDLDEYIDDINRDEMARIVKLADRIDNLNDCLNVSRGFARGYLRNTKEYFPELAKGNPLEADLKDAIKKVDGLLKNVL